jgi:hypothetical protein
VQEGSVTDKSLSLIVLRAMNGVAMAIYTIDNDNMITAYAEAPDDGAAGEKFASARDLSKTTAEWPVVPAGRGLEQAANWRLETREEVHGPQDRRGADLGGHPDLTPIPAPDAATGAKAAAKARKRPQTDTGACGAREGSKKAIILTMLRNPVGATLTQIMEATHWQPHTVRGFISGVIGKQLGLKVESTRTDTGERRYRIMA